MQSSAMNSLPARLNTSSHSRALSRSGPAGVWPTSARLSVAVDEREAAKARLLAAFAASPEEQPGGCADPARDHKARAERAGGDDGEVRAKLCRHVRRLAHLVAQLFDRVRELLALQLDVVADLLRRARVTRHRSSAPPASAWLHGLPAPGPAEFPSSCGCGPRAPGRPRRRAGTRSRSGG